MIAERFSAQLLTGEPAGSAVDVVRRLLAVQGQDPRGARLAIRARSAGLTAADVDSALTSDRSLLITWLNRGTLHLVSSEDYWWLHALTTPPLFTAAARRLAQEGLSGADADKAVTIIETALAADGPLTREQLGDRIAAALGGTAPSPVLDYVWGAPAEPVFRSLGRQGLDEDEGDTAYVQIGALAGPDATVPPSLLRSRRIRISGSGAGSASIGEIMEQLPVYMQRIADGLVTVPARAVPLRQAADAWLAAENGGDRVVVVPD
jgi:hypothetical protein